MSTITLGGKEVELPPMSLRVMRLLLPKIGDLQHMAGDATTGDEVNVLIGLSLQILAIWLDPPPRSATPEEFDARVQAKVEELEDSCSALEAKSMGPAIKAALELQGMQAGESPAPAENAVSDEASTSKSTTSSANSSEPDLGAEAGPA